MLKSAHKTLRWRTLDSVPTRTDDETGTDSVVTGETEMDDESTTTVTESSPSTSKLASFVLVGHAKPILNASLYENQAL